MIRVLHRWPGLAGLLLVTLLAASGAALSVFPVIERLASPQAAAGLSVTDVADVTGVPAILGHRVVTLHPKIHGGILADPNDPAHQVDMETYGIEPFDLVVANLYPFASDPSVELIDIGGPAMVRAAAKNHASVAVVVSPLGYDGVLAAVRAGGFSLAERKKLAALAFRHTAEYDVAVAGWMESTLAPEADNAALPPWFGRTWRRSAALRYGENPHQRAALYSDDVGWPGLAQAQQLHGKEMSYNNYTDADAAWRAAFDHSEICVAIIKHANPCGIAVSSVSAHGSRSWTASSPSTAGTHAMSPTSPTASRSTSATSATRTRSVLSSPARSCGQT